MSGAAVRALVAACVVLLGWFLAGPWLALLVGAACLPFFVKTQDGRLWAVALGTRLKFRWATLRKRTRFFGPGRPAALASIDLISSTPHAVIAHGDRYSVVLDGHEQGSWQDLLDSDPLLERVTVTSQSGVHLPGRLVLADTAPALAREILTEAAPASSLLPDSWVCLTWHAGSHAEATQHIAQQLTSIGARALSGDEVTRLLSLAYRPQSSSTSDWDNAGPTEATEQWNHYIHDGQTSVVWRVLNPSQAERLQLDGLPCATARVSTSYARESRSPLLRQTTVLTITGPTAQSEELARAAAVVRSRAAEQAVKLSPACGQMASTFAVGIGFGVGI